MKRSGRWLLLLPFAVLLVGLTLLAGCTRKANEGSGSPTQATLLISATALPPSPTATPSPSVTPTPQPKRVWLAPYLPAQLQQELTLPEEFSLANAEEEAQIKVGAGDGQPVARWTYALVAPFPTIPDGVSLQELKSSWSGTPAGPFGDLPLLMEASTLQVFSELWGPPAEGAVKVLPADQLLPYAWDNRPAWAILPFEALEPKWKVLQVDGLSPLWKDFDPQKYPLTVDFSLTGDPALVDAYLKASQQASLTLPLLNRDPAKLTTVMLTGVTALVRATAETMRRFGITYPARFIAPLLQSADILHVSNEIPFVKDCPQPDTHQTELVFCSRPEYIGLLDEIGTDIVELTGDHFGDWGPDAMRYTLDLYKQRGWPYYGGGYNQEDARQARLIEHNGNKIAFIGCNAKGGGYATARGDNPGAVECDPEWMHSEIARLHQQGYNVITTFQHFEYYSYQPQPKQVTDFRGMAEAGAAIVSGSQAHQPQGLEFYKDAFIHYGLGNLFFDQFFMGLPTSQGFLDRHVFYDNKYISTELIGIYFIDYASPRLMTPEEKETLLKSVFSASTWQ